MNIELLFEGYLKEGEQILWVGQPKKGILIRDADMILIPMSIILIGFSIILDYTLLHYQSSFLFKVFGILLAVAGIYMGLVRFFTSASRRARTFYCITTSRVIVMRGSQKKKIKTLPLKNIDRMEKSVEKDGSGFIIFGGTNPLYPWLLGGFYFTEAEVPGLDLLPDVASVYSIILKQIRVDMPPTLVDQVKTEESKGLN